MRTQFDIGDEDFSKDGVVTVSSERPFFNALVGAPDIHEMVVPFTNQQIRYLGSKEFSYSLYKKLIKSNPETIRINEHVVNLDKSEITSAIEEAIKIDD